MHTCFSMMLMTFSWKAIVLERLTCRMAWTSTWFLSLSRRFGRRVGRWTLPVLAIVFAQAFQRFFKPQQYVKPLRHGDDWVGQISSEAIASAKRQDPFGNVWLAMLTVVNMFTANCSFAIGILRRFRSYIWSSESMLGQGCYGLIMSIDVFIVCVAGIFAYEVAPSAHSKLVHKLTWLCTCIWYCIPAKPWS